MERNRVLWVIFSISLFLVVVLAAGLYFLRPRAAEGPAAAGESPRVESFDAFEYVRGRSALPGLQPETQPGEEVTIVVGEPGAPPSEAAGGEQVPSAQGEEAPGIPIPRELAPPVSPPAPSPSQRVTGTAAPVERARPQPAPKTARRPAPKPAPQPAPRQVRVTEYWIQVGSFESRKHADELSRSLAERGLAPKVTTRLVGGATHYRVRLGPYPNKAEAGKFLEWVRALEGLESSYISMVTLRRTDP
jgi:cell division septation protein DedD